MVRRCSYSKDFAATLTCADSSDVAFASNMQVEGSQGGEAAQESSEPLLDRKRRGDDGASITSSTRSTHSRTSLDTTVLADESDPLLANEEQPPAYSPRQPGSGAPSSVWLRASHAQYSSYGAILTDAASHQQQATTSNADTERQGTPSTVPKLDRGRRHGRLCKCSRSSRRFIKVSFLSIILLVGVIAVVLSAISIFRKDPEVDMLAWPSCPNAKAHRSTSFEFQDHLDFGLEESISDKVFPRHHLDGKILVRQGSQSQSASIKIDINMESSYLTFDHVSFTPTEKHLDIRSPDHSHGGGIFEEGECTTVNIVISIKSEPYMASFSISAAHMSIELSKSLRLAVSDMSLRSVAGSIANAQDDVLALSASRMNVETADGDINGNYVLDGHLTLRNNVGSINAGIFTQAAQMPKDHLIPANLVASTTSGNIKIDYPDGFAGRDYRTDIKAASGSISGTYAHGSRTVIGAVSGPIKAKLLPYWHEGQGSNITTHNVFGSTDIEVLPARSTSSDPMTHTRSRHESVAGSIKIRYPSDWEGSARGNSLTGRLDAAGADLEITEHSDHTIRATKGKGNSRLHFGTVSGNADLLIGG